MNSNIVQNIPIASKEYKLRDFKHSGADGESFNLILKDNIKTEKKAVQENNLIVALNVLVANIVNANNEISSIKDLGFLPENISQNSEFVEELSILTGLDKSTIEKLLTSLADDKKRQDAAGDFLNKGADFDILSEKKELLKNNINIENIKVESLEDKLEKLLSKVLLKNDKVADNVKSMLANFDSELESDGITRLKTFQVSDEIKSIFSKENDISNIVINNNKMQTPAHQPIINMNSPTKVNDLIEIIEFIKSGESKKMTVKLEPDFLGKMNIHLTENAGKITAKIFVEQEVVKHFLVANMDSIKQQLNDKGIVIDNMDFMFMGDHHNQQEFKEAKNQNSNHFKTGVKVEQHEIIEKDKSVSGIYA
ncbi:flagellar hook-length control protein FliK [Deferribacteraceae bacterium V6Fe1]|nr:flagellar hook-length control protein FliK [Deferribacteraceae bacterium V6Fe1]